MPLAFFCTLFFRHRKKSVSVPWDGKSQSAPESARQSPPGELLTAELFLIDASRVAFRSPPAPLREVGVPTGREFAPTGASKGFPRGKQSARPALPCASLVVCLNDRSLTAFGGCIHWMPASLRSPLETFGPRKLARFLHWAEASRAACPREETANSASGK